jgi:glycosyltransferase involved in cell wall biosynthesis
VATDVGGVRESVRDEIAGLAVHKRTPAAMTYGIEYVLARPRQAASRTCCAAAFDWESMLAHSLLQGRVGLGSLRPAE